MKFFIVPLVLCFISADYVTALSPEEITEVTETCCYHAESVAVTAASVEACSGAGPPDYIEPEQMETCQAALGSCCKEQFKFKDECSAGMKLAAAKRCGTANGEIGKTCCEECSFGKWTGESQGKGACGSPAGDDVSPTTALRKNAFYQCCLDAALNPETTTAVTTTEKKVETTTEKKQVIKCQKESCDHNCDDDGGVIKCSCREGYRLQSDKKTCKDINECAEAVDDLCTAEDTVCHNTAGTFKCVPIKKRDVGLSCPPGFKRNLINQVCDDINECQLPRPPCPKYLCENTIGGYKCAGKAGKPFSELPGGGPATEASASTTAPVRNDICPPGFRAGPDDECLDIDECDERLDDCQRLSQHCINTHGNFFCQDHVSKRCAPGFKVNSATGICEDIDECEESSEVCKRNEVCINLPGAYNCKSKISTLPKLATKTCQEGTRLRPGGTVCEDIDECREGTHLCDQFQNCVNTFGGHECRCKSGFELDSVSGSCADVDECALKLDNCGSGQQCLNILGSFTCTRKTATTSTTIVPPLYEYEYYDSDDENGTDDNSYPDPIPIPTTTTRKPRPRPTTTPRPRPTTPRPTTTTPRATTTTPRPTTTTSRPTTTTSRPMTTTSRPMTTTPRPTTTTRLTTVVTRPSRPYPRYPTRYNPTTTTPIPTTPPRTNPPPRPEAPRTPEESPRQPDYYPRVPRPEYIPRRPDNYPYNRPPYRRPESTPSRPEPPITRPETPTTRPETPFARPETPVTRPETTAARPTRPVSRPTWKPEPTEPVKPDGSEDRATNEIDTGDANFNPEEVHCLFGLEKDANGNCVDADPCSSGQHSCTNLEYCIKSSGGGYICDCIGGFHRDSSGWCVASVQPTTSTTTPVPTTTAEATTAVSTTIWGYTASRPHNRYTPTCELGYTYDSQYNKCVDIDECATNTATCEPLEDCLNVVGGYRCRCGPRCRSAQSTPTLAYTPQTSTPRPTTPTEARNVITVGAQYGQRGSYSPRPTFSRLPDVGAVVATCPWGYKLTPDKRCFDIDECARNVSQCGPEQRCENFYGGYSCQCPSGHRLVGQNGCEDIDECLHGSPCAYNADCVNSWGSYRCVCREGFKNAPSNDKVCVDLDECSENPGVCSQGCSNTWGSYRCHCKKGYRLNQDGRTCEDVNECEEYAAVRLRGKLCGGECINEPGSYRCSCPSGYRLSEDGRSCIDIDECETGQAHCAHASDSGYVCQNTRGSYHCHHIDCPSGYKLEAKHRCTRIQRSCQIGDWDCLQQPSTYSYNFITFVANIYLPSGSVDLFTMHGPAWRESIVNFEMRMIEVQASSGVRPADFRCFDVRPSNNICVISLLCSLEGPQVVELELTMSLYQRGIFAGRAVARLIVIVSQYDF